MDKVEALKYLGVSDKGARAYLALLELGRGTAYTVAKKSGLKQPTAYVVLDELREKGLVSKTPRPRKHLFTPRPPEELVALATGRMSILQQILPELVAIARSHTTQVRTLFYEGIEGLRQALWYRLDDLNQREILAFWASGVDANQALLDLSREWNKEVLARGITNRAFAPRHSSLKEFRELDAVYGRQVKIIPLEDYSANISIETNDYFVRIIMFKEAQAVIIDNPNVAKTLRQIFEMLWRLIP